MRVPKPKLNLPNYTQIPLYVGGAVIVATVIIGGFIYNKSQTNSSNNSSPTIVISSPPADAQKLTTAPYDGVYVGNTQVAQGISSATVTVSNNKISGRGVYVGANNINVDLKIDGKVDVNGNVSGSFSGSKTIEGMTISGSGTYTGKIIGNSASIDYSASAAGENHKGSFVLTK